MMQELHGLQVTSDQVRLEALQTVLSLLTILYHVVWRVDTHVECDVIHRKGFYFQLQLN